MKHFVYMIAALCCLAAAYGQEAGDEIEDLFARAATAIEQAHTDQIDLLSPRTLRKAVDGLAEARSLRDRESDERLIRIQLNNVLSDVEKARETARTTSKLLDGALRARQAVIESGARETAADSWKLAEEKLYAAVRDAEAGREEQAGAESDAIAETYWAVRREGLRNEILSGARGAMRDAEEKKAERTTPTLLARAQQALSRAETAVAQEELDEARRQAKQAEGLARQAIAMIDFIQKMQSEKFPWETALLGYEDLLRDIAVKLGGEISFAPGGTKTYAQFERLIEEHDRAKVMENDSLRAALEGTSASLEGYLSESQTSLADAQNKINELEKRLADLEGARSETSERLERRQETARRVTVAQGEFQPSEALVLQDEVGNVVIRVIGIQFSSGGSSLTAKQIALLSKVASAVRQFPGAKVTIEGHTDSEGGEDNNKTISEKRADAVAYELAEKLGVSVTELTVVGYGEERPIADNRTKQGRAQNRRIDVLLEIP